jgi:AAA+ ATPase superfamily predicted ATPase
VHPPLLRSYRELFNYVAEQCRESRVVVVIDEFQRLAEHDPAFLMELQAAWDEFLSDTKFFLRFWFKFVRPNLYLLELGEVERVASRIAEQLDEYVSTVFEDVAPGHFSRAVPALRVGRRWRGDVEIDGVAIDEKSKVA